MALRHHAADNTRPRLLAEGERTSPMATRLGVAGSTSFVTHTAPHGASTRQLHWVQFDDPSFVESCDRLFMETQPAHLQWGAGRKLEPEARDIIRAQMIREKLQSSLPPAIDLSGKEN